MRNIIQNGLDLISRKNEGCEISSPSQKRPSVRIQLTASVYSKYNEKHFCKLHLMLVIITPLLIVIEYIQVFQDTRPAL